MTRTDKNRWVQSNKLLFPLIIVLILLFGYLIVHFINNPDTFANDGKKMILPLIFIWLTLIIIDFNKSRIKSYKRQLLLLKQARYCEKVISYLHNGRKDDALVLVKNFINIDLPTGIFILGYLSAFNSQKSTTETHGEK